jgi:predicted Zn-ribbon and HTH transcriptional regulator
MIHQSELVGCKDCGIVFWSKARKVVEMGKEPEVCPNCNSQKTDKIDRSS